MTRYIDSKTMKKVFEDILKNINPNFKNKTFFGITGTNGKTTTAHLLNSLLGDSSIFVGTIDEDNLFEFTKEEHLTTPKLFNLVKMLSIVDRDVSNVVLEVSSHALDQKRLNGLYFKMYRIYKFKPRSSRLPQHNG